MLETLACLKSISYACSHSIARKFADMGGWSKIHAQKESQQWQEMPFVLDSNPILWIILSFYIVSFLLGQALLKSYGNRQTKRYHLSWCLLEILYINKLHSNFIVKCFSVFRVPSLKAFHIATDCDLKSPLGDYTNFEIDLQDRSVIRAKGFHCKSHTENKQTPQTLNLELV